MTDPTSAEKNALEHPTRAAIMAAAGGGKTTTTHAVAEQLPDSTWPAVVYHFGVLESLGLIAAVDTLARNGSTINVYTATERGEAVAP